jgi:phospholysine phosphohistidine inorganic pyrophosphate phosphatase
MSNAAADLRAALAGVRALLLDLDGVIVRAGEAVPGSVEAIRALEERRIPYRIVTNTSLVSRASLSRWAAKLGNEIPPERFQSALSASAAHALPRSLESRSTSWPRTTPGPSSRDSAC